MKAKVTLFQMKSVLGDLDGNKKKIINFCLSHQDSDVIVTPELSICGYPPEDLIFHTSFLQQIQEKVNEIIEASLQFPTVHLLIGLPVKEEEKIFNCAYLVKNGKLQGVYRKHNLPNYGVFDENRYFEPGDIKNTLVFEVKGTLFGVNICEDLWHADAPRAAKNAGAQVLLVPNASPFERTKQDQRYSSARKNVLDQGMDLVYVNSVGAQDEIVFDGFSFAITKENKGNELPGFKESELTVETAQGRLLLTEDFKKSNRLSALYSALVLSFKDYAEHNGFNGVVLGLSGGVDSALVLKITVDAVGADKVEAVMMPSRYTSHMSLKDAEELAESLHVKYKIIPIWPLYEAFESALEEEFKGYGQDVTEENLQARIRAVLLMAISNKKNYLLATTGNKSEMAVGYSTLYGDLAGGFAVIKDLYKTEVYDLCHWLDSISEKKVFPENILTRAPSAELRDNQKDQDSLPDYAILDAILKLYIEQKLGADKIIEKGFDEKTVKKVISMVKRAEYKRRQGPIGPKMSNVAFGRDWRYPITNKFKE